MGDFEKKIPARACRKKKIAGSTNVIESVWEKKGKYILPIRLLEKKFLMTRNFNYAKLEKIRIVDD